MGSDDIERREEVHVHCMQLERCRVDVGRGRMWYRVKVGR